MILLKLILIALIGLGSGIIISGGIFAFIAILGVVPRMAQKTKTEKHISLYEDFILLGGLYGAINLVVPIKIHVGLIGLVLIGFFAGVFVGGIAVSIAEILDVIPVLTRRIKLKNGLVFLMFVLAIGKAVGSILYFLLPGFVIKN